MFPECQWPHTGSGLEVSTHRGHRWPEKSTSENAFSLKGRYLRTLAKLLSLREGLLGLAGFWWIGKGGLEDGGERAGTEIKLVKRDSDRRVARVSITHEVCFLAVIHASEQKKKQIRGRTLAFMNLLIHSFLSSSLYSANTAPSSSSFFSASSETAAFPRNHSAISIGPLSKDVFSGVFLVSSLISPRMFCNARARKCLQSIDGFKSPMTPLTFFPNPSKQTA